MKNLFIQPYNQTGCSAYCISNFGGQPYHQTIDISGNLGEMTLDQENEFLQKAAKGDSLKIERFVYHHSSVLHIAFPVILDSINYLVNKEGMLKKNKKHFAVLPVVVGRKELGWSGGVFFVDDNFIGNKRTVKPFLKELISWQEANGYPFSFTTEASIDTTHRIFLYVDGERVWISDPLSIECPSFSLMELDKFVRWFKDKNMYYFHELSYICDKNGGLVGFKKSAFDHLDFR